MGEVIDHNGPEIHLGDAAQAAIKTIDQKRREFAMSNAVEIHKHEDSRIVPANDAPMVAMIERIAMDPNIPIDRLEKMLAMKERMEDRAREDQDRFARQAYFKAMAECQADLPVVVKRSRNDHTKSTYADLAAIEQQAMPTIHRYGFMVSFQPAGMNDKGEQRIKWTVAHSAGHIETGEAEIPVDNAGTNGTKNKTGTQAFGSTATYGRRYLLCMLFNISTGDDRDGNNTAPQGSTEPITADQVATIRRLIDQAEVEVEHFCERWEVNAVSEIEQRRYQEVIQSLHQRINWLASQQQKTGSAA